MLNNKKQLFFSHSWRPDNLFRDNHERVKKLVYALTYHGWKCWLDEYEIYGNIDACMANGIENCECVLVFITESYCNKINEAAQNPNIRDNCYKEWNYANNRNKLMIPIIMEPCLLNTNYWPDGIINLYFGSTYYIDYSQDNIKNVVKNLTFLLNKYNIYANKSNKSKKSKKSNKPNKPNKLNIYPNKSNNIVNISFKNLMNLNLLNNVKKNNNELKKLPPSPINGSPNNSPIPTPNITPNVSNQNLSILNKNEESSPLQKFAFVNNYNLLQNKIIDDNFIIKNNKKDWLHLNIISKNNSIRHLFRC